MCVDPWIMGETGESTGGSAPAGAVPEPGRPPTFCVASSADLAATPCCCSESVEPLAGGLNRRAPRQGQRRPEERPLRVGRWEKENLHRKILGVHKNAFELWKDPKL
jgi:hypothetical protein